MRAQLPPVCVTLRSGLRDETPVRDRGLYELSSILFGAIEPIQLPRFRQPLQHLWIVFLAEAMLRAGHKVPDRARHEDLSGCSRTRHPRRRVHSNPFNTPTDDFALPGMYAHPEIYPDFLQRTSYGHGELNCSAWAIENQKKSVAGRIDLAAAMGFQMSTHQFVMVKEQRAPHPVSDPFQSLRRGDDVGKHKRQQGALRPTGFGHIRFG